MFACGEGLWDLYRFALGFAGDGLGFFPCFLRFCEGILKNLHQRFCSVSLCLVR